MMKTKKATSAKASNITKASTLATNIGVSRMFLADAREELTRIVAELDAIAAEVGTDTASHRLGRLACSLTEIEENLAVVAG